MQASRRHLQSYDDIMSGATKHQTPHRPPRVTRLPAYDWRRDTNIGTNTATTACTNLNTLLPDGRTLHTTPNVRHAETQMFLTSYGKQSLQYSRPMQLLRLQLKPQSTQLLTSTVSPVETSRFGSHEYPRTTSDYYNRKPVCHCNHVSLLETHLCSFIS